MARTVAAEQSRPNHFSMIPSVQLPRSSFDRSFGVKTTFDAAYLVPIFLDEALPGDTMTVRTNSFVRMTTPLTPVMDNMWLDFFFFFVPNRLVWDNWERFNGAQDNPGDTVDYMTPVMTEEVMTGSLSDQFGLPLSNQPSASITFQSMPHRAYNLIWNEWFRSEDLQDSAVVDKGDGPDDPADYFLRRRCKRHDYFTSCLPFRQKGDPVTLPLGTEAPIATAAALDQETMSVYSDAAAGYQRMFTNANLLGVSSTTGLEANRLYADLSDATAATINDIREAFQMQRLLERDARGGTRYTEIIRSHFGVVSPDQRLQRPEYLGGGSTRVNIHPVANTTSQPAVSNYLGLLGGFATAAAGGIGFSKSFTEHGWVIGLVNVRADITYQQNLDRMWSRRTRFDFFWPSFQHLGEQAVLNKEIVHPSATDDEVFGYQERYAEYRYKQSQVRGVFRSGSAAAGGDPTLDKWHLALDFGATVPTLNDVFIEDDPPMARILAIQTAPHFFGDFWFNFKHVRPMATYSVPGLIDHF